MSDYYISFIPEEPNYIPDSKVVEEIKGVAIEDCVQQYLELKLKEIYNDQINGRHRI